MKTQENYAILNVEVPNIRHSTYTVTNKLEEETEDNTPLIDVCPFCGMLFQSLENLAIHIHYNHENDERWQLYIQETQKVLKSVLSRKDIRKKGILCISEVVKTIRNHYPYYGYKVMQFKYNNVGKAIETALYLLSKSTINTHLTIEKGNNIFYYIVNEKEALKELDGKIHYCQS